MKAYGATHVGRVRAVNQDAYYLPEAGESFAVVADGMGGHKAGEVASAMAVSEFTRWLRCAPVPTEETVNYAVHEANRIIHRTAQREADKSNMGTTLVSVWVDDEQVIECNVGDSRAYLLRGGALTQISRDHSLVGELVEEGKITKQEAMHHPHKNYITRAIGTSSMVQPEIRTLDRKSGDVWLLCSDGMSNYIEDGELERILREQADREKCVRQLIDLALERGGADNITVVLVDCGEVAP
ncbi:MAG: Stp1/IreP family PP2C-type Ser/Thr phosphatase [Eubacteriales bacterium]|mgnify:FL=1|nr:Stp1/IreP family PP2C-type Ser/Thr phosphatase [bacterium]MDY2791151.1 Stp1/IreP family PP2C-type Ser/Thr phosphatase [Eubacteriales bacterium]